MRILQTARTLARIAGPGAGWRYLRRAGILTIAAHLDAGSALLLLWRRRLIDRK